MGAGVAGLTLAYRLLQAGRPCVVVERDGFVGGLARSYRYGDFCFDVGPKRFHTDDPQILEFLLEILEKDHLVVGRSSAVHLFDRYFTWPLDGSALFRLPLPVMISSGFDLLRRRPPRDENSFTEYVRSRYGDTLYRLFFKPYTEKFLRIPCEDVHVDWARTGINRAVIDKRVKSETLFDLVRSVLLPRAVVTDFLYPSYGGFGTFCTKLAEKVQGLGGEIRLNDTVTGITVDGGAIGHVQLADGSRVEPHSLVWSGNLLNLAHLLDRPAPALRYLSTVLFNIELSGSVTQKQQWIYYSAADMALSRVTVTNEIGAYMSPPGKTGLCVEVTCFEGDAPWSEPESFVSRIKEELLRVGLVRRAEDYGAVHVERVRDTYPIYDLRYRESFSAAARMVKGFSNLKLLGRTGAYWYNNSDHSMKMSLQMARHLVDGAAMADKEAIFGG